MTVFSKVISRIHRLATKYPKRGLLLLLVLSLILRLFIAFSFEGTGDTGGWRLAGKTGLQNKQFGMGNGTVYDGDCPLLCSNWPPLTYHYYLGARWLFEYLNPFHLPQWGFYKLLPILASIGISYLLYKFAIILKLNHPIILAAAYAFHPLSLYISAYHGQRESVWLFLFLLSLYFLIIKRYFMVGISFAMGAAIKIPILLFTLILFIHLPTNRVKVFFIVSIPTIFFLLGLPEIFTHTENVIKQVFFYQGAGGWWGFLGIAKMINLFIDYPIPTDSIRTISKLLQYAGIIGVSLLAYIKKVNILESILGIIAITFVFSPIFASQYMLWPLLFLLLLYKNYKTLFWLYSLISIQIAANSYGIFGIRLLEKYMLEIPNTYTYNNFPPSIYPFQFYLPLWILSIAILIRVISYMYKKRVT